MSLRQFSVMSSIPACRQCCNAIICLSQPLSTYTVYTHGLCLVHSTEYIHPEYVVFTGPQVEPFIKLPAVVDKQTSSQNTQIKAVRHNSYSMTRLVASLVMNPAQQVTPTQVHTDAWEASVSILFRPVHFTRGVRACLGCLHLS